MSQSNAIARLPSGHFAPGKSANPGGKPAAMKWNAAVMARELATATNDFQEVRDFLLGIMRDESRSVGERLDVVRLILDYGIGKPAQAIQLQGAIVHGEAGTPAGDAIAIAALVAQGAASADLEALERALAPLVGAIDTQASERTQDG